MSKLDTSIARFIVKDTEIKVKKSVTTNVFCPTGKGGGSDPSCSPKKSKGSGETVKAYYYGGPIPGPDGKTRKFLSWELSKKASKLLQHKDWIWSSDVMAVLDGKRKASLAGSKETETDLSKTEMYEKLAKDPEVLNKFIKKHGFKAQAYTVDNGTLNVFVLSDKVQGEEREKILSAVKTYRGTTYSTETENQIIGEALGFPSESVKAFYDDRIKPFTTNAAKKSPSPLQVDPSRTATIQRAFEEQLNRRFKILQAALVKFIANDFEPTVNVFCPTGKGGGVDSSCSLTGSKSKSSGLASKLKEVTLAPMATGGSLSVASAVKLQKSLHELYTTSKDFKSAVDMIKEQTVTDVRANLIQTIVRSSSKGKDPTKDKTVLKAVDKYNEIEDNEVDTAVLKSLSSKVQGYLNVLDEAPKSDFVIYRGQKKTKSVVGDEIEFDVPSSMSQSKDVATHYAGGELLIIRPGVKYLSTDLLAGASEGLKGGVAEHRSKRVGYEKQQVYFNASMGTDEEIIAKGKFKVLSVKEDRVSYEDQLTGKQKSKSVRILELEPIEDSEPATNAFKFQTSEEKLQNFEQWLISKLSETMEAKDIHRETDWWQKYIDQAYEQGSSRAFDEVKKKGPAKDQRSADRMSGAKSQFFSTPGSAQTKERIKLIAARTYKGMKGLTDSMKSQLTLALIDGLLKGESPKKIATRLAETLDISKTRAKMIARTEIIRAHSEGTLATLKALGVTKVGVQVEIAVSGNACPICQKYKNRILTIEEAEGLFPLHPNCKCTPIPHISDEPSPRKERQRKNIERSIKSSSKR